MKRMAVILLACTMIFTLSACGATPPADASDSSALEQKEGKFPLSSISTVTLDGEAITGDALSGEKLTVVNVWGTWCPPCVEELPHLQEVSELYADQGVKIVGVLQDGVTAGLEPDDALISAGKKLLEDAGAEYTVILPDEPLMLDIIAQMQYFPTTFFIDSENNIIKTVIGSNDVDGWRQEIDEALAELS